MGKKSKKQEIGITRKQAAMSVRDKRARSRLMLGVLVLASIVVVVLIIGVVNEYLIKPNSPVAVVDGDRITTSEYQKMARFQQANRLSYLQNLQVQKSQFDPDDENNQFLIQYYDQLIAQASDELANLGPLVLEQMIEDRLIRRGAEEKGILVTDDMVEQEIEELFGYYRIPPTPAPTPTPDESLEETPTVEEAAPEPTPAVTYDEFLKNYQAFMEELKRTAGFGEADYRELVRSSLIQEKLIEAVAAGVPSTAEQVWARHILVEDRETADMVLESLRAGADFAELAQEYSTDTSNKYLGGDLGWFTRGTMVTEFEEVAFSLPVGEISEPVETMFGFHIIKVEDYDVNRELDTSELSQVQEQAFRDWMSETLNSATIERYWSPAKMPPEPTPAFIPQ